MRVMLLNDIRDYQILFLSLFLALGIGTRDWTLRPELIGVAIATCLLTQWMLSSILSKEQNINLRSALITSLGLSLLLRADHWTTMALAAASAIASKFFSKLVINISSILATLVLLLPCCSPLMPGFRQDSGEKTGGMDYCFLGLVA